MILGIDPGKAGAMALIDNDGRFRSALLITVKDDGRISKVPILSFLNKYEHDITAAFLEETNFHGKNGAFGIGELKKSIGHFEMALEERSIKTHYVTPQEWQKGLLGRVPKGTAKKKAWLFVDKQFPNVDLRAGRRCKNPSEGLIDALAIAEYGRRMVNPPPTYMHYDLGGSMI